MESLHRALRRQSADARCRATAKRGWCIQPPQAVRLGRGARGAHARQRPASAAEAEEGGSSRRKGWVFQGVCPGIPP